MRKGLILSGMIALLPLSSAPAQAQYAIINDVIAFTVANMAQGAPCTFMPENELAEARGPAPGIMQRYFAAAASGGAKSALFKLNTKTRWTAGATVAGQLELDKQSDPLAVTGNSLTPEPLRFYRAGTFGTALGQWAVRNAEGGVAGVYTAQFERERGEWKLRDLAVSKADDVVEPIAAYCVKPGDSTGQRVTSAVEYVTWSEKRLAKRQAKFVAADAAASAAETKGGATAKELRATADREKKRVTQAEEALVKARERHGEAVAAAEEIKRLTQPARNAEQFRQKNEAKSAG